MNPIVDFHSYIGTGGAALIERATQWIRVQFRLNSFMGSVLALVLAVVEQFGLSYFFHYSIDTAAYSLALTLLAVFHVHEISKS